MDNPQGGWRSRGRLYPAAGRGSVPRSFLRRCGLALRRRRRGQHALLFVLILVLASCQAGMGAPQAPATATGGELPGLPAAFVDQQSCVLAGHSAQCGYLPVYENRAAQSGRMINLKVGVIRATSPNPAPDPVFFLAGGPGDAATEDTGNVGFIWDILQGKRDIVLVDQRGTGGSHQVLAPLLPDDLAVLTGEEFRTKGARWVNQELAEQEIDPRYYTTSLAMDDLDDVRQALGYDEVNLWGGSYGATAAQYYLRQHEEHVRTVVLVCGSLLDVPLFEREAANAQRTLDLAFAQCEADAACQAAFPDLRAEFAALLERLQREPVVVTPQSGAVTLTPDVFAAKVQWICRDASRIISLPRWIHRAYEQDDWQPFAEAGIMDFGSLVMSYSIRCSEKWAAYSPAEVARQGAGSYLLGLRTTMAEQAAQVCGIVPPGETPEGQSAQPPSLKPVLLFNGDWDVLDPPASVAGAQALWPNSLSLVLPYQGHEISNYSVAACMGSIVREFVERASVEGLDGSCLQALPAPHFDTRD